MHFPSIGTLRDFGDDGFGITKHKDDIWKEETHGWKSDMVIVLLYINNSGFQSHLSMQNTFLAILHEL